jgi:hypothetical protein
VLISVVKSSWVKCVKFSEVLQCSDGLRKKASNIIRRHIDNNEVAGYMYFAIITYFHIFSFYFLSVYIWLYSCLIL